MPGAGELKCSLAYIRPNHSSVYSFSWKAPAIPDLRFSLDLGSALSPLLLICFAILLNQARKGIILHFDQRHDAVDAKVETRHAETTLTLGEIKAQVIATNGRVTKVEDAVRADHDLLMTVVGKVEVLTGKQT